MRGGFFLFGRKETIEPRSQLARPAVLVRGSSPGRLATASATDVSWAPSITWMQLVVGDTSGNTEGFKSFSFLLISVESIPDW